MKTRYLVSILVVCALLAGTLLSTPALAEDGNKGNDKQQNNNKDDNDNKDKGDRDRDRNMDGGVYPVGWYVIPGNPWI